MLGLRIDRLEISVITNNGDFHCSIQLKEGLNIIRAENSSGKSTCANAIAYGLGLEAILGPSRKRPFPKSLYEEIFDSKKNQNPSFVSASAVYLDIRNDKEKSARLVRDIAGNDSKICVEMDGKKTDYFLGSSGRVGSAASERGFHYWLADFIGWKLPSVVKFDGAESTLYLECIFPLFFIEQKRGWSEIQANIPAHYGIKNVKRVAAEFCLDIDSFEFEKKVVSYKNKIEAAESDWDKLITAAKITSEFNSVELSIIPEIENFLGDNCVEFYYPEGDAKISVSEKERSIKALLERLERDVRAVTPDVGMLEEQNAILRKLRRDDEDLSGKLELTMLSIAESENKLTTLKNDLDQYQQLRRLKKVGGDIGLDLDTDKCPICEGDLYDTLGVRNTKRQPMTLEENIDFLKSQIEFFEAVRNRGVMQLDAYRTRHKLLKSRYESEVDRLKKIHDDLDDINGATKALLRERIMAEAALKDAEKLRNIQDDLRGLASKAHAQWITSTEGLKLLRKQSNIDNKEVVINKLQSILRDNLAEFQFSPSAISTISISHQTLRPEQEGYDIVAETSASDYIRIIWAYTLALMELAGREHNIKHGGFVVFDEPRQHEASKISFMNLIKKSSESKQYGGQVIFATSLDEDDLILASIEHDINLIFFDDYILRKEAAEE